MASDKNSNETMKFDVEKATAKQVREVVRHVYKALTEKGYNPVSQMVGYILSGDPTYITSHDNARSIVGKVERDEILEELIKAYLKD